MEEKRIQVSVVVPVYQVPLELLQRCLDSLKAQTLDNLEVLLVFDEPAQSYLLVVEKYQDVLDLHVLEQAHGGVSAARNLGMHHARGTWVSFVDSDDWIDPEMLSGMAQEGKEQQADIVMGQHIMEYGTVSQPRTYLPQPHLFEGTEKGRFECDVLKPQTGAGFVTAKLFRRSMLEEGSLRFREDLSAAEDAEFMFRVACKAQRILCLPRNVYHYWFNTGSAVRAYRPDYAQRYIRSMEAIRTDLEEMGDREYCRDAYDSCVLYHLLLIAVNDSFHPGNGLSGGAQRRAFRAMVAQPIFAQALKNIHYGDFSTTRKITLLCLQLRCYLGVELIAKVRHWQFHRYAGK